MLHYKWYILLFYSYFLTSYGEGVSDGEILQVIFITVNSSVTDISSTSNETHVSFMCPDLQSALELSELFNSTSSLVLYVPPGKHIIRNPVSIKASVQIIGNKQDSLITCSFTRSNVRNDILHTMYFNNSYSVYLGNFHAFNCPLPFRFDTVRAVKIDNISVSCFTEAALEIYNSQSIHLNNSQFVNNQGSGIIQEPYRGNTGAVAITYWKLVSIINNPNITVSNCRFINNSAYAGVTTYRTNSDAAQNGVLTGRAGGLGMFISASEYNVSINIYGCIFHNNYATSYSGGLFFIFNGTNSQYFATVDNCEFIGNTGVLGGGGFITTIQSRGHVNAPHTVLLKNSYFERNRGDAGGGVYYFVLYPEGRGNLFAMKGCTFVNNGGVNEESEFGAAFAASLYEVFKEKESLYLHGIEDSTFINNTGRNGVVSLAYLPFNLTGTNTFIGNNGDSLRVIGSRLTVGGELKFIKNTAVDGGALSLLSFAQMRLNHGVQVLFQENNGRYGSSIFVDSTNQHSVLTNLAYNPQCFLLIYRNEKLPPSMLNQADINITFTSNTAYFGSAIYISSLSACSWYGNSKPYFNMSYFPEWPIFNIRPDNVNSGSFGNPQTNSIITSAVDIKVQNLEVSGWPGENLQLTINTQDELGNPSGALLRLSFLAINQSVDHQSSDLVRLNPDTFLVSEEPYVTNVSFHLNENEINGRLAIGNITVQEISFEASQTTDSIPLVAEECLGGYQQSSIQDFSSYTFCSCEMSQRQVLLCEEDYDSVIIQSGEWTIRVRGAKPTLYFHRCPPGYCQCFFNTSIGSSICANVYMNSQPDRQCACGRRGIMCGECPRDKGVSALLNRCTTCSNANSLLIVCLVFIDVLVVVLIVLVGKPLPSWIYPALFYIQSAPLIALYFPETFLTGGIYLYYIYSTLSLYFPYDFCIAKDMSAIASYALRFLPAVISFTVITITTIVNSSMIGKRCLTHIFRHLKFHGVWTIILLTYSHTVYTAMNILNCPSIPTENGRKSYWYIDGSVECFSGTHIPLSIFAIFMLFVCALLPPGLSVLVYRNASSRWLSNFVSSLSTSYNPNALWWSGVELGSRLLFVFFIVTFPGNTLVLVLLIAVLIALYGYYEPYKNKWTNYLEVTFLSLFLCILMLRVNQTLQDNYLSNFQQQPLNMTYTSMDCSGVQISYITHFAKIILMLYYLPIIMMTIIALNYMGYRFYRGFINRRQSKEEDEEYMYDEIPMVATKFSISYVSMD